MSTTADPKKLVKALQTGRRKLGMTDEEYRGLLSSVTVAERLPARNLPARNWSGAGRAQKGGLSHDGRTRRSGRSKASGMKCTISESSETGAIRL